MTANQIAYWNLEETKRTNRAKENETARHNQQDEYVKLIGNLNNPFSLASHAAGGSNNLQVGLSNQLSSILGGNDKLKDIASIFLQGPGSAISGSETAKEFASHVFSPFIEDLRNNNVINAVQDFLKPVGNKIMSIFK